MKTLLYLFATFVIALSTALTIAQECCITCGCPTCVRKVCHVKCEIKKVPVTEYSCECEDFCVPGPSKKCGKECTVDCHGCEKCKTNWIPQCAEVHTRNKLKKTVTEKEEKTYKWVVETLCEGCAAHCVTSEQALRQQPIASARPSLFSLPGGVQPASFNAPASGPVVTNAAAARRTWRSAIRLPWQR
jgi:hypothetical protein